jgi:hypothetical protein
MPARDDAALEAEFPETVGLLRTAAAELRAAVDPADGDRMWADVLARAANVPHGMSVDDTIRHIVEHSSTRINFPPDFDPEAITNDN